MRPERLMALATSLLLAAAALTLTACGLGTASEEARVAVEAVARIDTAVPAGVDLREYEAEIHNAKAALNDFRLQNATDERIAAELSMAFNYHVAAHEACQADRDGNWDEAYLGPKRSSASYWQDTYPDLEFGFEQRYELSVDDVTQRCWAKAAAHVEAAREQL